VDLCGGGYLALFGGAALLPSSDESAEAAVGVSVGVLLGGGGGGFLVVVDGVVGGERVEWERARVARRGGGGEGGGEVQRGDGTAGWSAGAVAGAEEKRGARACVREVRFRAGQKRAAATVAVLGGVRFRFRTP